MELSRSPLFTIGGLPCEKSGRLCNCFGACSAFTHVMASTLAESSSDPLHRKPRQLRCLRCRLAAFLWHQSEDGCAVSVYNKQSGERSQSINFLAFLFGACLLLCGLASAAPFITLSKKSGPPTSRILVSGRGFAPNTRVDIYFDAKDEAVAVVNSAGSFSKIGIPGPASALPGHHWVSVVGRSGGRATQTRFDVHANWRQFHRSTGSTCSA